MDTTAFPTALRERRVRRRLSQLDLALLAGTTQRHVSFLERGRSSPGRDMVLRLAESLQLPLRERNRLLSSAGFAPVYAESRLDGADLAPVREALRTILDGHEPYPAIVVARAGRLVSTNRAFDRLVAHAPTALRAPGANAYRLALHPEGLGGRVVNLAEWGRHVLDRLDQAITRDPDPELAALRDELADHVPATPPTGPHLGFAVPARIRTPAGELRLMTTITTFATAVDVTLADLRLEAFLPADAATAAVLGHRVPPGRGDAVGARSTVAPFGSQGGLGDTPEAGRDPDSAAWGGHPAHRGADR